VTPKKTWKPLFLERLREHANVSRAADAAGISRKTVYKERNDSVTFAHDWDDALEEGLDYLEEEARRRAYEGVNEPVYYKGEDVGAVRKYSDTLMIFLLKGGRPERYAERSKREVTGKDGGPIEQKVSVGFDLAGDIREIDRHITELEAEALAEEGQV
jgi:hypothetical protein